MDDHDHKDTECLACEIGMSEYLVNAKKIIEEYGWMVQGVSDDPQFAYSCGLRSFGLPEIMIVGPLPQNLMTVLINDAGKQMKENGPFEDWVRSYEIIRSYSVVFRELTKETIEEHCGIQKAIFGEYSPKVLQMILPDPNGKFPWEEGCTWTFQSIGRSYVSPDILGVVN